MSGVQGSRTRTPQDAWPGGHLRRRRRGLAARKPGPPDLESAQAARRSPAVGGVASEASLRHPPSEGVQRETLSQACFGKG